MSDAAGRDHEEVQPQEVIDATYLGKQLGWEEAKATILVKLNDLVEEALNVIQDPHGHTEVNEATFDALEYAAQVVEEIESPFPRTPDKG